MRVGVLHNLKPLISRSVLVQHIWKIPAVHRAKNVHLSRFFAEDYSCWRLGVGETRRMLSAAGVVGCFLLLFRFFLPFLDFFFFFRFRLSSGYSPKKSLKTGSKEKE